MTKVTSQILDTGYRVWFNGNMSTDTNPNPTVWVSLVVAEDGSPIVLGAFHSGDDARTACQCEYDLYSGEGMPTLPWSDDNSGFGAVAYPTDDGEQVYVVQRVPLV